MQEYPESREMKQGRPRTKVPLSSLGRRSDHHFHWAQLGGSTSKSTLVATTASSWGPMARGSRVLDLDAANNWCGPRQTEHEDRDGGVEHW